MMRHVCVTGRVNGDGDRTGINPACYAYEVRSSGLIGFADFVGVALTFYVGAVIGCGECLGAEGLIDGGAYPREGEEITYPQPLPKWGGAFVVR